MSRLHELYEKSRNYLREINDIERCITIRNEQISDLLKEKAQYVRNLEQITKAIEEELREQTTTNR